MPENLFRQRSNQNGKMEHVRCDLILCPSVFLSQCFYFATTKIAIYFNEYCLYESQTIFLIDVNNFARKPIQHTIN